MNDFDKNVDEVITDLKQKIDNLLNAGNSEVNAETFVKISDIRKRAINVLKQALEKIVLINDEFADPNEISEGINVVKERSKELYETALARIQELEKIGAVEDMKEDIEDAAEDFFEDTTELVDNARKEIDDFFTNENVEKVIDKVVEEKSAVVSKTVSVLKDWLKPEGK